MSSNYFVSLNIALIIGLTAQSARAQFTQTNLFSDVTGQATLTDPSLINPWGIASSPTSPVWVANEGSGVATLYTDANNSLGKAALTVTIPGVGGNAGTPTGTVFNSAGASDFRLNNGAAATFLFSTLDGQIVGWNGAMGTTASIAKVSPGSEFTGLAIAGSQLYAADFHSSSISVFSTSFALIKQFTDSNLPPGYAPFNVQTLNSELFVTYALQNPAKNSPVAGAGNGFVDIFDLSGNLMKRLVSNGVLNAPWGLAIAPAGFGPFGGDLLVGNNGDGTINVFDPITGLLIGTLKDGQGNPIIDPSLFALAFGNGTSFNSDALLFTTGGGLFGEIEAGAATPLPAALPMFSSVVGAGGFLSWLRRRKRRVT